LFVFIFILYLSFSSTVSKNKKTEEKSSNIKLAHITSVYFEPPVNRFQDNFNPVCVCCLASLCFPLRCVALCCAVVIVMDFAVRPSLTLFLPLAFCFFSSSSSVSQPPNSNDTLVNATIEGFAQPSKTVVR
jgi:hypothetical protein